MLGEILNCQVSSTLYCPLPFLDIFYGNEDQMQHAVVTVVLVHR